jgi:hypothetical protein
MKKNQKNSYGLLLKACGIAAFIASALTFVGCESPVAQPKTEQAALASRSVVGSSLDPVTVSGTVNSPISTARVVIHLTDGNAFNDGVEGNAPNWFTNTPAGLVISSAVFSSGNTIATVTVTGTPTQMSSYWIAVVIPGTDNTSRQEIDIPTAANAIWDIRWPISNWTDAQLEGGTPPFTNAAVNAVAYGNGVYLVSSYNDGSAAFSTDGSSWMAIPAATTTFSAYFPYILYVPANGAFYAVGAGGTIRYTRPQTLTSTWADVGTGLLGGNDIRGIAYNAAQKITIIVGNSGQAAYLNGLPSGTGDVWHPISFPGFISNFNSVATAEIDNVTVAVIVGQLGFSAYSNDNLQTWTDTSSDTQAIFGTSGSTSGIKQVTYAETNNRFVAVGYGWTAYIDFPNAQPTLWDGVNVQDLTSHDPTRTAWLNCVTYGGGYFVAGGSLGKSISSPNGIDWAFTGAAALFNNTSDSFINNIAYNGDGVYMIGGNLNNGPGIAAYNTN